jgi:hypothetical protein
MSKLYLDDIRTPADDSFLIVRSFDEAVRFVIENGVPEFISFDHDLGIDDNGNLLPSGYDFAKWLVESGINGTIQIPDDFSFNVHSQNPVGASNIRGLLENYLKFRRQK